MRAGDTKSSVLIIPRSLGGYFYEGRGIPGGYSVFIIAQRLVLNIAMSAGKGYSVWLYMRKGEYQEVGTDFELSLSKVVIAR